MPTEMPAPTKAPPFPTIHALSFADLRAALVAGLSDFARAPLYGIGIGAIFALTGLGIVLALTVWDLPWMIYPFAIGFPLIGPFAAVGLFEVSRRLEAGEPLSWSAVLSAAWLQRGRELSWMAFVMLFVFWMWMYQVRLLIALFLGRMSFATLERFFAIVFTTSEGWLFLAVGHFVGAALALVLFSITVVSIPLLMEREYDFITAMIASVKTVVASPVVMLGWGLFVTVTVIAASLPLFAGLPVILPILGHATWHIYRKAVAPVDS